LGDRKGIWPVKKTGCWFVGGDDLTGALHILQLRLAPPSLAPIKSRMETLETFWYWLTQVHLKRQLKWRERDRQTDIQTDRQKGTRTVTVWQ